MERDTKVIILALTLGLLLPAALTVVMAFLGVDVLDIIIQAILLFSMFPIMGAAIYMWATGKGTSLISGYNTSPRAVQEQYDSGKLSRFVGKFTFFSTILILLVLESMLIFNFGWPFWVLLAISAAIITVGIAYMNTGGRFLKENALDPKLLLTEEDKKSNRQMLYGLLAITGIITVVILIIVLLVAPAGGVTAELQDEGLHVDAPMVNEFIPYGDIDSAVLWEDLDTGRRVGGFGGTHIRSGNFQNEEFGRYKLASNNAVPLHIAVYHSGGVLAFNLETVVATQEMFDQLEARL